MSIFAGRLARLRALLASAGLDALLVSRPENRRYMSGYRTSDSNSGTSAGWLLIGADDAQLITNSIEYEQARQQVTDMEVVLAKSHPWETAADGLGKYHRVGFEDGHLTVAAYRYLQDRAATGVDLSPAPALIESLRLVKDDTELSAIRRAAELTDQALAAALAGISPGVTEKQLAWQIEVWLRERGAELAFPTIVASGPNAALPHAEPSDRPIGDGEPVIIDMGARWDGYNADLTRTFCLNTASDRLVDSWNAVAEANRQAMAEMRAGVTGKQVDAAARDYLASAGYGDAFIHSVGHGVGLAVHEGPRASSGSTDVFEDGMVVTDEPGVYFPGWGGVRIEDLVVIRPQEAEVLSHAPKELVIKTGVKPSKKLA